jgi:hypothetical protein
MAWMTPFDAKTSVATNLRVVDGVPATGRRDRGELLVQHPDLRRGGDGGGVTPPMSDVEEENVRYGRRGRGAVRAGDADG